ncbi:cytochrome c oxidase subunit IVB [Oceanobacillus chungangensis]|uniref:Cytochrome c oxidase subunit IVB n=1 Tax=Oceanobacillus chungangensis TaxID=1229152 RepID=A0A3D8PRP4_9BACI|nr:cytochrome c oxidase subunit IVB [Oceanobacillus chungangensis]RDW17951.1 cytochrome c oxidase subunit IVB [Oceanobacillus chungangensis]
MNNENMNIDKINSFQKQQNKEEMKKQIITFVLMIAFTVVAFAVVASGLEAIYAVPLILILAVVQVGFQFYYFMHMKDEGHEVPAALIYGGIWVAILVALTMATIIWW